MYIDVSKIPRPHPPFGSVITGPRKTDISYFCPLSPTNSQLQIISFSWFDVRLLQGNPVDHGPVMFYYLAPNKQLCTLHHLKDTFALPATPKPFTLQCQMPRIGQLTSIPITVLPPSYKVS